MVKARTMDLTQGPIMKKLIAFAIPVLLTSLMNQAFTVVDKIVVGRFAENGTQALAAVGASSLMTGLFVALFSGLSVGANVICANRRGAKDQKAVERCMHSAILLSVVIGVSIAILGALITEPFLRWMKTPEDIMDQAVLYALIYCAGIPGISLNVFGGSILQAHGDTKRPMYNLMVAGTVNVVLNMILVIVFHLDVAGVAIATVISQYISAGLKLIILFSPKDVYRLQWKKLRMDKESNWSMIRVGVPCSLNSMGFSIANLFLQSAVNTFGSAAIAGKTAALDITTLTLQGINAGYTAAVSFVGQCFGAKKYDRVNQVWKKCLALCIAYVLITGLICTLFSQQLLGLFTDNAEAIEAGRGLLLINSWGYFLYAIANVTMGCLRGMGKSSLPSTINVLGICVPRILWVLLAFPLYHNMTFLYLCNPISWVIIASGQCIYYFYCKGKLLTVQTANGV